MVCADTNIIVRFIVDDNKEMADLAETAILSGELFVSAEIFAEAVYVLYKVYGIERDKIARVLSHLLSFVSTDDREIIRSALSYYAQTKLDFVDCILAARHIVNGDEVLSFDKKLNNFLHRKEG